MFLRMKVEATNPEEVSKDELALFVAKSLEQYGFPPEGFIRLVFFKRGVLYQTDNLGIYDRVDIYEGEVVFVIDSWEKYINFGYPEGINENSTEDEKISAYVNDSIFGN